MPKFIRLILDQINNLDLKLEKVYLQLTKWLKSTLMKKSKLKQLPQPEPNIYFFWYDEVGHKHEIMISPAKGENIAQAKIRGLMTVINILERREIERKD